MTREENPPTAANSAAPPVTAEEVTQADEAEHAKAESADVVTAELSATSDEPNGNPAAQTSNVLPLENVAAKGGAVGSLVLGAWSIIGSFITPFSFINAILGLMLGLWGMSSNQPRLAFIGLGLSTVGLLCCLAGITSS